METTEKDKPKRPTALITGGSRGIGLALAKQFAQHGHDLVLVARNAADLERAVSELQHEHPCTVVPISLDLTADDAPSCLALELKRRDIQIDVLVNNAGVGDYGPLAQNAADRLSAMLKLNVVTLSALTRQFLPDMIARGRGRILNLASVVAYFAGGPGWSGYVASKHYVLAFTRGLSRELSGSGVSVTALCPGPAETDFIARSAVGGTRAYRWLPKTSVAATARAGYRAAMAGRTIVIPGLTNKLFAVLGELPPRGIAQAVFAYLLRRGAAAKASLEHSS